MNKTISFKPKQVTTILTIVTLILIGVTAYSLALMMDYRVNGVRIAAEIVDIDWDEDDSTRVTIRYEVDGVTYTEPLGSYSSSMDVGETVDVYYMPDDPTYLMYAPTTIVFPAASGVFAIVMIVVTLVQRRNRRISQKLLDEGERVALTIKDFSCKESLDVMGKHPAVILCTDSQGNEYKANFLYDNKVPVNVGDTLYAYVDREDPSKYVVDVLEYLEDKKGDIPHPSEVSR